MTTRKISAAVLAGGRSLRMGRDKALLTLEPGGPTFLQRTLDTVRAVADDVMVIANDRPEYAKFGARLVPDHYPGGAALGAIATALEAARSPRCLVVPCDLPLLNAGLLTWLAEFDDEADVVVPIVNGFVQPLHAIYRDTCLEPIRLRLRLEQRQVVGFFPRVRVREVPETAIRAVDPDLLAFFNANTPEALDQARAIARAHRT